MRKRLFDTGSAQDYIYRRTGIHAKAQARRALGEELGICPPVLGELWAGVEMSASRQRNAARLRHELSAFKLWPYTKAAAEEFGRLRAFLRRAGRPMQQIDIQIAAIVLTLGNCTLITKDSDFAAFPGLAIANWSVP